MKKHVLILALAAVVFLIPAVHALANPAAVYCSEMREFGDYEYKVVTAADGSQSGICVLPDSTECKDWDFYNGKCGADYSYCAKNGYELLGANCIVDGAEKSVSELMNLDSKLGGERAVPAVVVNEVQARRMMAERGRYPYESYNASNYSYWDWRAPPNSTAYGSANYAFFDDTYGWTTSVKDQGSCGSCWAFSTDGSLESTYEIEMNNSRLNPDLSEQYLVTYDTSSYLGESQAGCGGGWMDVAMRFIMNNEVVDEACDAYVEDDSSTRCSDYANRKWNITNYTTTYEGGETILQLTENETKQWIIDRGPMAAAIYASQLTGSGGIERCTSYGDSHPTNHGVVIIGYNDTGTYSTSYWILKNSWGTGWGNSGYFKLGFGECNITSEFEVAGYVNPPSNYKPSIVLNSPPQGNATNNTLITFNFTSYNRNATNATCDLIINGVIRNATSSAVNATAKTLTYNLSAGSYNWSISCWENNLGIANSSETRALQVGSSLPSLQILSPANTTYTTRQILVNITNSSDTTNVWWYNGTTNLTYAGAVYYNFSEGSRVIYAYANDSAGNINATSVAFFIDSVNPGISFTAQTENSSSTLRRSNIAVNVTASDTNLANITLVLYNSTLIINTTNTSATSLYANFTNLADGLYYFNATAVDTAGNTNRTEARNVTVNAQAPVVLTSSPANSAALDAGTASVTIIITTDETAICRYNTTDTGFANMTNMSSTNSTTHNMTVATTSGTSYDYHFRCQNIYFDNATSSYHLSFSVNSPASSPPSGGGGGGSGGGGGEAGGGGGGGVWAKTYNATAEQFASGFLQDLGAKQRVQVVVNNEYHYVGVVSATKDSVTINISSKSVQATLSLGEEKKFEINDDNYYDILVTYTKFYAGKAYLDIKKIYEPVPGKTAQQPATSKTAAAPGEQAAAPKEETKPQAAAEKQPNYYPLTATVIVLMVLLLIAVNMLRGRLKSKEQQPPAA